MSDSSALGGPAGMGGQDGPGVGGGVFIASGTVGARDTDISGNYASTSNDDVFGELGECP